MIATPHAEIRIKSKGGAVTDGKYLLEALRCPSLTRFVFDQISARGLAPRVRAQTKIPPGAGFRSMPTYFRCPGVFDPEACICGGNRGATRGEA